MGKLRPGNSNLFRGRDRVRGKGLFSQRRNEGQDVWEVESSDEEVVVDDGIEEGKEEVAGARLSTNSFARKGRSGKKGEGKSVSFVDDDVVGGEEDAVEEKEGEDDEDNSREMQGGKRPSKGRQPTLRTGSTDDEDTPDDEDQPSDGSSAEPDISSTTKSPGKITCRIAIGANDPVGSTSDSWTEERIILIPASTTIKTLDSSIQKMLVGLLEEDEALLEAVKEAGTLLWYELILLVPHCGETDYRPTNSRHKFETIGDLFRDPQASGLELQVDVPVVCDDRLPNVENQKAYAFNQKNSSTASLVVEAKKLDKNEDRWEYCHARIGIVATSPSGKGKAKQKSRKDVPSSSNDAPSQDGAVDRASNAKKIPLVNTLVGEWFKGYMKEDHDLSLISVHAWDFGDYCIGHVDICAEHTFSANDEYFQPCAGVQSQGKIAQIIRKRLSLKKKPTEPGSGVPFMPIYTLNDLDSKALGLGVNLNEYEDQSVDAVVRFVDHIRHRNNDEDDPREALSPPWLPFNAQFQFYPLDPKFAGPIESLTKELKKHSQRTDLSPADKKAIQSFVKRKDWKLQLWVLPQKGRRMYRFPNQHEDIWGGLEEYLDEDKVEKGGRAARALYMEAHIVKRDGSEKDGVDVFDVSDGEGKGEGEEGGKVKGKGNGKARDGGREAGEQDAGESRPDGGKRDRGSGKAQVQKKGIARKKR